MSYYLVLGNKTNYVNMYILLFLEKENDDIYVLMMMGEMIDVDYNFIIDF